MTTLSEIEAAARQLPPRQQRELLDRLTKLLADKSGSAHAIPLVPATGKPISQKEIDDALDSD